jgi:hypothetical protein
MVGTFESKPVITSPDVRSFFETSLQEVSERQGVSATQPTLTYVAGMLTRFSRTERLVEKTPDGKRIPVLALLYAKANSAPSANERSETMQRLGDVALFLSGVFSESFNRKLVDVDYCISMGASAYDYLSEPVHASPHNRDNLSVFAELSRKFTYFVDVLNEVCEQSAGRSNRDLMRLYEVWLRTRSPRAAQQLRALGVNVSEASTSRRSH